MVREYRICHVCGGKMFKCVNKVTFRKNGSFYDIPDVTFYQCPKCGEKVFDAAEVKRIESEMKKHTEVSGE